MKPAIPLFTLLLLAASGSSALSAPHEPPAPPPGVTVTHNVEMGLGGKRPLVAEIACPSEKSSTPMPAIILIHGGGWIGGKPADFLPAAYLLAAHGYFVICPEYRLAREAKWPAQIEDCKLAVRWLRANAASYGIDPLKIGCWGGSAGGHLAACLGVMDDPALEGAGGHAGVSSKVQAVCDESGPADFTDGNFGNGSETVTEKQRQSDKLILNLLLGATFEQNPDLWKQASPVTWVRTGAPPFLVINGDHDQIVATAQGIKMFDALKKAGVPAQMIIVKNGDHVMATPPGLSPATPNYGELVKSILAFFDQYLKKT